MVIILTTDFCTSVHWLWKPGADADYRFVRQLSYSSNQIYVVINMAWILKKLQDTYFELDQDMSAFKHLRFLKLAKGKYTKFF